MEGVFEGNSPGAGNRSAHAQHRSAGGTAPMLIDAYVSQKRFPSRRQSMTDPESWLATAQLLNPYDFPVAGILLFPDSKIVRAFKRAVSKAKIPGSGDIHMKHFPHQGTARLCNRLTNGGPSHNREVVVAIEAGRERAKARSASIRPSSSDFKFPTSSSISSVVITSWFLPYSTPY